MLAPPLATMSRRSSVQLNASGSSTIGNFAVAGVLLASKIVRVRSQPMAILSPFGDQSIRSGQLEYTVLQLRSMVAPAWRSSVVSVSGAPQESATRRPSGEKAAPVTKRPVPNLVSRVDPE